MRKLAIPTLLTVAIALLSACGGSATPARQTSPFTEEHAAVFEDGVDFIADPTALEGRWRQDWSRDLDQRVTWSDLIAKVTINTLRTDTDLDRLSTFRLIAVVEDSMWGDPPEEEMVLTVREGEAGFGTIEGNERRILNQPFIAFVKWVETPTGEVSPHWHLAPATEEVTARVEYLIENRLVDPDARGDRRVIVHEN